MGGKMLCTLHWDAQSPQQEGTEEVCRELCVFSSSIYTFKSEGKALRQL